MKRKFVLQATPFPHRYSATVFQLLLIFTMGFGIGTVPQASSQSLNSTQLTELEGVRFAVPQGFQLEQSRTHKMSFMRDSSEPLALFVAVPDRRLDRGYLTGLSGNLVSLLLREDGFRWKIEESSDPRVSQYQTHRGTIKGLKGKRFVQIDYVVVRAQDRNVVVGSIALFGEETTAPFLFEVKGREYSVRGWQALFQLISSITGEKETELRRPAI